MSARKIPVDALFQGHCMGCAQLLRQCICLAGPMPARPIEELRCARCARLMCGCDRTEQSSLKSARFRKPRGRDE